LNKKLAKVDATHLERSFPKLQKRAASGPIATSKVREDGLKILDRMLEGLSNEKK